MNTEDKLACPCCGYVTITSTSDICSICGWQHDPVQESDPDHDDMGPNRITLRQAQDNFAAFGAKSEDKLTLVRPPGPDDLRDPNWRPLS